MHRLLAAALKAVEALEESIEYKTWLSEFFEQFRFKPKDPTPYLPYGYKPIEEQELVAETIQAVHTIQVTYQDAEEEIDCR